MRIDQMINEMMLSPHADKHFERLKTTLLRRYTAETIARWIIENTFHSMALYSYKGHEYQERILSDTSVEVVVKKCSQVGISEASARMALALVCVMNPYTVAYTLPTAGFAGKFAKTRIDPIIDNSPNLKAAVHKTNNNNEVKQFGESFLFLMGAQSSNAPISVPVDHLIHDELDFSDLEVLGQYVSRLTHSKWRRKHKISTPTHKNYGIDREFTHSRRHFMFVKCSHCNHRFIPNYYNDVRIPGLQGFDLRDFTKRHLSNTKWKQAKMHCPRCGNIPELSPKYREWVCENLTEDHIAAGYQVSPFDAPTIVDSAYLINASTAYDRRQDFDNFGLGQAVEDREATFLEGEFSQWFTDNRTGWGYTYVMGVDQGHLCHFTIGAVDGYGKIVVVHKERVGLKQMRKRYHELRQEYRISCTVMDHAPNSELVMALQEEDQTLYAAVYVNQKTLLTHRVIDAEEDEDEAKSYVRQVNINRSRAFDGYLEWVRKDNMMILREDDEIDNDFIKHHCSMKRTRIFMDSTKAEEVYIWQKTDGEDHFHHSGVYMHVASQIRKIARPLIALPLFSMRKIVTEVVKKPIHTHPTTIGVAFPRRG